MKSALICPGPGRSGTSLLHFMFANIKGCYGPREGKEYSFFAKDRDFPYERNFDVDGDDADALRFEFSPRYTTVTAPSWQRSVVERIRNSVDNPFVIFPIREPVARSISAYRHFLHPYARFGKERYSAEQRCLSDPYRRTFDQAVRSDQLVGCLLSDIVGLYVDSFGKDNVMFFFLEEDAASFDRFYDFVLDRTGFHVPNTRRGSEIPKFSKSKGHPRYYYSQDHDICIRNRKGREAYLSAGQFYICNERGHEIISDMDPEVAASCMDAQKLWTREFSAAYQSDIFDELFREDFQKLSDYWVPGSYAGAVPDYFNWSYRDKVFPYAEPDFDLLNDASPELKKASLSDV
ncbi:hypothetical protein M2324_003347 [Rhodovulum sulfidophilum]|uniref:hypothetical protein n=1 Tax=Rhodovulum sulfidophilum TaxID=35806 RepID=UPI0012DAD845|nr:hypothetical protein [Rhodovulum sulfidophilum]MCW2304933.1 hypothetical protein [Rhodovulum sulfidophilum]